MTTKQQVSNIMVLIRTIILQYIFSKVPICMNSQSIALGSGASSRNNFCPFHDKWLSFKLGVNPFLNKEQILSKRLY